MSEDGQSSDHPCALAGRGFDIERSVYLGNPPPHHLEPEMAAVEPGSIGPESRSAVFDALTNPTDVTVEVV